MEADHGQYMALVSSATTAEWERRYWDAIRLARSAWPHIDGTLQYARRYMAEPLTGVEAIDVVLRCAPVLLDTRSLTAVTTLLAECKRIEREAGKYADRLDAATVRLGENHRLWSALHQAGEIADGEQPSAATPEQWGRTSEEWAAVGLVTRAAGTTRLTTRLGELVTAKCATCGRAVEAPKGMFFEPLPCDGCGTVDYLVIAAGRQ